MAEPTPQKIRATIEDLVERYKPQEFRVEINAHQKAYSLDDELRNWLAGYGVRLMLTLQARTNGTHPSESLVNVHLFGTVRDEKFQKNNIIELPSSEGSEGIKALTQQLLTWKPDTKGKTDCCYGTVVCGYSHPRTNATEYKSNTVCWKPLGY
jgi:hypothetical protein